MLDIPVSVSFKSKLETLWFCLLKLVVKEGDTCVWVSVTND